MPDYKTKTAPFLHRGAVQKLDPGLLSDGEFQDLENITSEQEGALSVRLGSRKYANASDVGVVHSMAKLALGSDATDPRYLGDGRILKAVGPYTVITDISVGLGLDSSQWEAVSFDSEGSGSPIMYFAHRTRMMRDDGSFTTLRPWGIKMPFRPAHAVAADPTINSGLAVLADQSSGSARLSASVSSAVEISANYYRVTLSSSADILPGTYVRFSGTGQWMLVDNVYSNIIEGRTGAMPSGNVESFYVAVDQPTSPTVANGATYHKDSAGSADWSLNGREQNGYDHNDRVHVGLYVDGAQHISEIRIRVLVGGSSSSYYEKAIAPSIAQAFIEETQTSGLTIEEIQTMVVTGVIPLEEAERLIAQIQSVQIPPTVAPTWYEFDISKLDFAKVGNAGSGTHTWKNVTGVQVRVISLNKEGAPTFEVRVGAIYAVGGQGPDASEAEARMPYDWLYVFRDPVSGAEGNPCVPMLPEKALELRNRGAQLTLYGADTDPVTGDPSLAGHGSIAVYRRGGAFADGFYRLVGYATNPGFSGGEPAAVTFVDNAADDSIAANRVLEFDNNPPVTSRPPLPLSATISAISATTAEGFRTLTLAGFPGSGVLSSFLSVGSLVHVGIGGANAEDAVVLAINDGASQITVYVQNGHNTGEQVTCEAILGQPCDIVCRLDQRILLAGDENNPNMVYSSKSGRPHAFPIRNGRSGAAHQMLIGSPDNPINGLAEWNGECVSLNRTKLFAFSIYNGVMTQPMETPATRGCAVKHAWCKYGNAIWYLSYDGIYSWSGGGSQKMTHAIDWIFKRRTVGAFKPVNFDAPQFIQIFGFMDFLWFLYQDTDGNNRGLRYSLAENRWEPVRYGSTANIGALTRALPEEDTGRLIGAVFSNNDDKTYLFELESGTSDGYTAAVTDGVDIDFRAKTAFFSPEGRQTQIHLQELVIELRNPSDALSVKVFYDFSGTADATDTFSIPAGAGRRRIPLPLQQSAGTSHGKECNSFALEISGSTNDVLSVYSLGMKWIPLADIQRGAIGDWQDLGHPWDKRLYEVTIEFNTHGSAVTLHLDTVSGPSGVLKNDAVQSFALDATLHRAKKQFAINDGVIAKLVRLRASVATADFEIFNISWVKEDYPADVVKFTEHTDAGTPYDKYFQQIVLDVNTNNQVIPVVVEGDGVDHQTVNVQSTLATRNQIVTLNPAIVARKVRLRVGTIPAGGMFQLFDHRFVVQPADKGPVAHTTDWDSLGHLFDKRLKTVTIEYDNMSQGSVTLLIDTLSGIGGGTPSLAAISLTLSATGRGLQTFAIPDGHIVKAVKLRPSATNVVFKMWGYKFDFEPFPADFVTATDWEDFGYEHEKIVQQIAFDVDTGGVAASVQLQADGGALQTLSITSTGSTREQIVTLNPTLRGKKFRLLVTPGGGGKFQLWKWTPKFERGDRGPVEHSFDYDDLGSPYDKRLVTVTFEYDTGGSPITMTMDVVKGPDGTDQQTAVQSFVLSGSGRSKQTFPIAVDTIVKMVRIRPVSTFATLKVWKYVFAKVDLPPDKVAATPWEDNGYPCGKALRSMTIDIDTGGVAASLQLQVDGANVGAPFSVTSTSTDRIRILTAPADTLGRMFRLLPSPGVGGKAQIFSVNYDAIREPCCVARIDTFEISLGGAGYKFIKQIWLQYKCTSTIQITIYGDGGAVLHQETLPAHPGRTVERFYLHDVYNGVPNKNKQHRIVIVPTDVNACLQLWGDQSRIESLLLSGDQRQAYEQHYLSMLTMPQALTPNS